MSVCLLDREYRVWKCIHPGFDKVRRGVDGVVFYLGLGKIKYIYKISYILCI